ncbi:MAG: hypothetical protein HY816_02345 [Candidatus Wallbacteria bacterium]|nr:hypothetical protein [Candidatus Wallbacteria bacterium]
MIRILAFAIALGIATPLAASDLYRIWLDGKPESGAKLADTYRTVLSLKGRFTDALLSQEEVATLGRQGFRLEFVQKDPEGLMRRVAASPDRGHFRSETEMLQELRMLAAEHPRLVRLEDFGDSWEKGAGLGGHDLWAVGVFSATADSRQAPAALFLGGVHSREVATTEVLTEFIHRLVKGHATDPQIRHLLDTRRLWIVPLLNPDGREYVLSTDAWWRKNRHRFPASGGVGVDLNRNFPFYWASGLGSSDNPASAIYRGEAPLSEPETSALGAFVTRVAPAASLSFHAYGQYILTPYGYPERRPEDRTAYASLGRELSEQTGYPWGTVSEMLGYHSSGRHDDWLYGMRRILSMEMELGRTFFPEQPELEVLNRIATGACLYVARAAGEWVRASLSPVSPPPPGGKAASESPERVMVLELTNGGLADARTVRWRFEGGSAALMSPSSGIVATIPGVRHAPSTVRLPITMRRPVSGLVSSSKPLVLVVTSNAERAEIPLEPTARSVPGE